jgi:hypothetical protein
LYYAGYLTMTVSCFHTLIISILIFAKPTRKLKIPNREVMRTGADGSVSAWDPTQTFLTYARRDR